MTRPHTVRRPLHRRLRRALLRPRSATALWALSSGAFYAAVLLVWIPRRHVLASIQRGAAAGSALRLLASFVLAGAALLAATLWLDGRWRQRGLSGRVLLRCWRRRLGPLALSTGLNLLAAAALLVLSPLAVRDDIGEYVGLSVGLAAIACLFAGAYRGMQAVAHHLHHPTDEARNRHGLALALMASSLAGLAGHLLTGLVI